MSTAYERALASCDESRVRLAGTWPSGNVRPTTGMPEWAEHWINWVWQFSSEDLAPIDAFIKTPTVNAGVRKLQRDVCRGRVRVWRGMGDGKTEVKRTGLRVDEGGNLADLLAYANEELDTGRQLLASLVGSLSLSGNGYLLAQSYGIKKQPSDLFSLPGHLVRPVPGRNRTIVGYEFNVGGVGQWTPITGRVVIPFRRYNPKDEPVGLSDLKAVAESYLAEYYATRWVRDFFLKGAAVPGVWRISDEYGGGRVMSAEELREVQKRLYDRHYGSDNRWLPVIVQGLEYVMSGMKLSEMELQTQFAIIESKIARALGIPPTMLGIKEGEGALSTSSEVEQVEYWLGTICDYGELISDVLTERLCPLFDRQLSVEISYMHVPAVQTARLKQAVLHKALVGRSLETVNEARAEMEMPLLEGDEFDQIYTAPAPTFGAPGDPGASEGPGAPGESSGQQQKNTHRRPASLRLAEDANGKRRKRGAYSLANFERRIMVVCLERLAAQRSDVVAGVHTWWERNHPALSSQNGARKIALEALDMNGLLPDPGDDDLEQMKAMFERILSERGIDAIAEVAAAAGVALEVEVSFQTAAARAYIEKLVERATVLPDGTTRAMLTKNLAAAIEAGGDLSQILAAVHDTFDARRNQALTIARTEALGAYNYASLEAWGQSEVVEYAEWLTSRSGLGGRHSEDPDGVYAGSDGGLGLDGQRRALGESFDVGGTPMLYPGDPSAPPGEVCNCVCTLSPVIDAAALARASEAQRFARSLSRALPAVAGGRLAAYFNRSTAEVIE